MKINILYKIAPFFLLAFQACNLTRDVDIELPEYERQPVVECYLEPGKPYRLLLTRSYAFFDEFGLDSNFLQNTLLDGAVVTISHDGETDTLSNFLYPELHPFKIYNYFSPKLVPSTPGARFDLNILLPDGRSIQGQTIMLPVVPIDSVVVQWNPEKDTLARVLTYITDDLNSQNYYRRLLNYSSLDSLPDQDFIFSDRSSQESTIAFGTGYDLHEGDTIFNTIFHITPEYYNYIESYQLAVIGNLNPFAQPSPIKSNVSGTGNPLGIFTCLAYDRDTTIIQR